MQGFGKNAGPRRMSSGSLPVFGSSSAQDTSSNKVPRGPPPVFGSIPAQDAPASTISRGPAPVFRSMPDQDASTSTISRGPAPVFSSMPAQDASTSTISRGPAPVFGSIPAQDVSANNRNRFRVPDPSLSSRPSYMAPKRPVGNSSSDAVASPFKRIRPPVHETPRSDEPSDTELNYQSGTKRGRSQSPKSDIMPRTTFQTNTERRQIAHTDSILDDTSVEPSGGNRFRSPVVQPRVTSPINTGRKQVAYTDSIFDYTGVEPSKGNQFRSPTVQPRMTFQNNNRRKQVAYTDSILDDSVIKPSSENQPSKGNQFHSPMVQPRVTSPINTGRKQVAYTDSIFDDTGIKPSKGNQVPSPMVQARTTSQINTGRKQVAYNDSIFDDTGVEPSSENQHSKGNQFQSSMVQPRTTFYNTGRKQVPYTDSEFDATTIAPTISRGNQFRSPTVLPRRSVLPQTSHNKEAAIQNFSKHSDRKSSPSSLHGVENSVAPSKLILAEREEEAKAKRLARFGAELSQPVVAVVEPPVSNAESSKQQSEVDFSEATAIVGLCPDMCPESERGERQRKGDLDKHERLDGDRNLTTKFLAVKKYNRTAERDPDLIRPLPILMKSMNYLLDLLNKPYGDDFLGLYNFLWDRMRAIRMDLRMQHIFNLEAISMLEQMIRLHIIAMHELCEYNKGEGFSEGFDAHLNIEQMNKASVELFQMYEDHKRKGIFICTEREFRGYYALLKLDKHPGYKVEPAELSLDLAKMSAEVRRSPEIAFARNVAKACRSGNYISFFRLAKKATYLQACLMHAHFSKLRTQALASLHSSFPSNQGMPLARLENMLAMEGEDIVSFVERHGFVLKSFEEMYIVKDGSFLIQEGDPLSKRSPLVGAKRSHKIKLDVCSSPVLNTASVEDFSNSPKAAVTKRISSEKPATEISESSKLVKVSDQEQLELQPERGAQEEEQLTTIVQERPNDVQVTLQLPSAPISTDFVHVMQVPDAHRKVTLKLSTPELPPPASVSPSTSTELLVTSSVITSCDQKVASTKKAEVEVHAVEKSQENVKLFKEKLKPIFRKWRQRAMELRLRREKKEWREALIREAMESLSVGPLLHSSAYKAPRTEILNIDHAIRDRLRKQEKSWSVLNTSELVTPILAEQNPDARCLCWKLLLSLPAGPTDTLSVKWLLTKFNVHETISFVSISKIWSGPQLSLSFVRADKSGSVEKKSVAGASSVLFLISGDAPLEEHKVRLHNLCRHVPANSNLPLLIAIGDDLNGKQESAIIAKLGLADIDQTKLRDISIMHLNQNLQNELVSNKLLDDGRLREGVRWLAEHSPPQSEVILVNTRTILLSYLKLKLEVLGDACVVGPDQCIAAINSSLDWLTRAIHGSASTNPNFWPCPEIELLEKSSSEKNYAEMTLPRAGWSEPQNVQAQTDVLKGYKLPWFGFDCSSLSQGFNWIDIERVQDQKQGLEEYLFRYLILYTGSQEAMDVARNLVQRCTTLVLRDSCFYVVPKWTAIFRRIFNFRLLSIPKDASDVYVSDDIANVQFFNVGWDDLLASYELPLIPLDEMIERCLIASEIAAPTIPVMPDVPDVHAIPVISDVHADTTEPTYEVNEVSDNEGLPENNNKQALSVVNNKFQQLLDQVTKVQDEIDKTLYFYF